MKLKKLTIENFRGFKHFECNFEEGINVLVGLNGFGKTSILDAISVAYGQFMSGFGTSIDRGISVDEVHLAKIGSEDSGFTMEYQLPSLVAAESYSSSSTPDFPEQWQRAKNSTKKNSRTTQVRKLKDCAATLQSIVQQGAFPALPLIAYYGTDRLWNSNFTQSNKQLKLNEMSRLEGYADWFKPRTSYGQFINWLYHETLASFERQMENQEQLEQGNNLVKGNIHKDRLRALEKALNKVLEPSGWSNVRYSSIAKQVIASHVEQGDVHIAMLSDGVRNMIGMIADIAFRAIRLNPQRGSHAVIETEGVVLIDEVDMHLHPSWQQLVLKNLTEAFPKIQFIVTTHSPQVLTTVKKESVHLMCMENGIGWTQNPIGETYGIASQDALLEVMKVNPRPPLDWVNNLKKYMDMIDLNTHKSLEGKQLRETLEQELGTEHHDLQRADRKIRRKGILPS